MASAYNTALGSITTQVAAERGLPKRRDLERALSASKSFKPSYTVLQRVADGTRPIRTFELAAVAEAVGVDIADLLPNPRNRQNSASARQATLELTVEQIIGLSTILDIDEDEILKKVCDATTALAVKANRKAR